MDDDQQFCLRWNNHQSTLISVFDTLLENETLVDCTLAAEGKFLKAHKVVLSACSPYFATLLQEQYDKHPIFILKDVKYQELRAMMDYMYRGEVNISQDQLAALLKAAESLQIKGLSDNRTGGSGSGVPKHDQQHRGLNVPGGGIGGGKHGGGYTLEQTKRARMGPSSIDSQDMSGSREGSSSPTTRRRKKIRRRSIENAMADIHDNSNSSQIQPNATSSLLQQQSNASLGVGAITAAASALASQVPVSAATLPTGSGAAASIAAAAAAATTQGTTQQLTTATNVTKKTEGAKGTGSSSNTGSNTGGDAINTELLGATLDEQQQQQQQQSGLELKSEKQNHKQQKSVIGKDSGASAAELVIEPKSEYDDEGNDETVEDLTLDDEDMGMEDLDHNAGTSHGNEGSSQGYGQWQHDRSQDEVFMATQEAQQRDPQDLSKKIAQLHKENTAPQSQIQRTQPRSILNSQKRPHSRNSLQADGAAAAQQPQQQPKLQVARNLLAPGAGGQINGQRKRLSMSDVSDMLFELYKANVAKAPKNQQPALPPNKLGQTSPTSAETEPSTIAAIATNGAAADNHSSNLEAASKNLKGDEMMPGAAEQGTHPHAHASFHPRIKYSSVNKSAAVAAAAAAAEGSTHTPPPAPVITAIPTSVLVATSPQLDVKPLIHPTTGLVIPPPPPSADPAGSSSVIQPVPGAGGVVPQAAAIAAALLRDGYHNFQQQLRAQEILKHQQHPQPGGGAPTGGDNVTPTKLFESFLRQQQRGGRHSECDNEIDTTSDTNDGDDEDGDDSRYNGFDDIHLIEGSKTGGSLNMFASSAPAPADYLSDESQKFMIAAQAQAQAFRSLEYSLSDYGGSGNSPGADGEPTYECRHCGKKYRWKSTLRRHENVECGGKEPSHQCPYCPYKSKQRGNLGVHVRKHHSNLPQLTSKRRSKYSTKTEPGGGPGSAHGSDDSSSKLMIDCSK